MLSVTNIILSPDDYFEYVNANDGFVDKSYASNGLTAYISNGNRYICADDAFNAKMCEWGE